MKRLLCIFLAMLTVCACTARGAAAAPAADPTDAPAQPTAAPTQLVYAPIRDIIGYAGFSDTLAAALLDGSGNRNLSPISVYLALAMTVEGASGETQSDMLKLLGCSSIEELRGVCGAMLETLSIDSERSTLAIADSLWMADRGDALTFRKDYRTVLADVYRSEANSVQFGTESASKQITDWIREHTHDKIDLSPDTMNFSPDTVAVLINTIYLKDAWRDEFSEGATEHGAFNGPDGDQTVDYMHRYDSDSKIVQGEGFLRYRIPLTRVGDMVFVLPDESVSLQSLLGSPEKLHALLNDGETVEAHVDVKLPKFRFQDQIDLNDTLISLGIGRAFDPSNTDFSGMCENKNDIFISDVLQGSYIGVDEQGVEAAAYTMVVMAEGMAMPRELPEIDFHLERPFLFAIESFDGTVLFIGTVTAPTPAE